MHRNHYDEYDEIDLGGGHILEVRGRVTLCSGRLTSVPLTFFTEDPEVDSSEAYLGMLLSRPGHGEVKRDTKAEAGFADAAFFADGCEVYRMLDRARFIEPWMIGELIYSQWSLSPRPLLVDLPNWFYLEEGLVSVAMRSDKKWGTDIRAKEETIFLPGSRLFVAL
ncbi:MAG: hypothetical protein ACM3TU_03625 [Bacillota bacterium]